LFDLFGKLAHPVRQDTKFAERDRDDLSTLLGGCQCLASTRRSLTSSLDDGLDPLREFAGCAVQLPNRGVLLTGTAGDASGGLIDLGVGRGDLVDQMLIVRHGGSEFPARPRDRLGDPLQVAARSRQGVAERRRLLAATSEGGDGFREAPPQFAMLVSEVLAGIADRDTPEIEADRTEVIEEERIDHCLEIVVEDSEDGAFRLGTQARTKPEGTAEFVSNEVYVERVASDVPLERKVDLVVQGTDA
jgi:hypothetical protein